MKIINIGSVLPQGKYKIYSVYANVINFSSENQRLISLVSNISYFSPNSIQAFGKPLNSITKIEISKEHILLNNKNFKKSELTIYNSNLRIEKKINIFSCAGKFKNTYILQFPEKSLAFLLNQTLEREFTSRFEISFCQYMKKTFFQLQSNNLIETAKLMRGAGFGLTPSGDDFNAGLLFGLSVLENHFEISFEELKARIRTIGLGKNLIVNELLHQASEGQYFHRLKNLLHSIFANPQATEKAFKQMLAFGSTSSGDMLTGFLACLSWYNNEF